MSERNTTLLAGIGRRQIGSDASGSLPVYHQLHLIIGQRIRDRVYLPGALLPSEFVLADQFGISRVTVRRTLALLERDGLIVRRRGIGTFVAEEARRGAGNISGNISGVIENLITIGLETEARLLGVSDDPHPPAVVRDMLELEADEAPVRISRLRLHLGSPFSVSTIWLSAQMATLIDPERLGDNTTIAMLEAAGVRSETAEQTISATLADHEVGALLEVPLGSALVLVRRTVRDAGNAPLLFQQSLYRPDRYEYHMLLTRDQTAGRPRWRHVG
ncbi:GntR family transcriptional regulator [Polymorphobacter sp.]|uniref:GntR family transcriptional regulator n=1 Tax=Polymorphobacter sp. TaxID=1909290 RepID=UPI003F6E9780